MVLGHALGSQRVSWHVCLLRCNLFFGKDLFRSKTVHSSFDDCGSLAAIWISLRESVRTFWWSLLDLLQGPLASLSAAEYFSFLPPTCREKTAIRIEMNGIQNCFSRILKNSVAIVSIIWVCIPVINADDRRRKTRKTRIKRIGYQRGRSQHIRCRRSCFCNGRKGRWVR
jgi:hypothetical protein